MLVGLMLSLGGGASALTFKSDGSVVQSDGTVVKKANPKLEDDAFICRNATKADPRIKLLGVALSQERIWLNEINAVSFVKEANRRRLDCGTNSLPRNSTSTRVLFFDDETLCKAATFVDDAKVAKWRRYNNLAVYEARQRGLTCAVVGYQSTCPALKSTDGTSMEAISASQYASDYLCKLSTELESGGKRIWKTSCAASAYIEQAMRRGLNCGVADSRIDVASASASMKSMSNNASSENIQTLTDREICKNAVKTLGRAVPYRNRSVWRIDQQAIPFVKLAQENSLKCGTLNLPKDYHMTSSLFLDNASLCTKATYVGKNHRVIWKQFGIERHEANLRGLRCDVGKKRFSQVTQNPDKQKHVNNLLNIKSFREVSTVDDLALCSPITKIGHLKQKEWKITNARDRQFFAEAKRRGLSCGVASSHHNKVAVGSTTSQSQISNSKRVEWNIQLDDLALCSPITRFDSSGNRYWKIKTAREQKFYNEAMRRGLTCGVSQAGSIQTASSNQSLSNKLVCEYATYLIGTSGNYTTQWTANEANSKYVEEAKKRGLTCDVDQSNPTQYATNSPTNAELVAARKRAAELEKQLALLQAKEELNQRQIASDNLAPTLTIIQSGSNGREGFLTGSVTDNVQVAEVLVEGAPVSIAANGSFAWTGFVPATGKDIIVEAIDTAALSSRQIVRIERSQTLQKGILRFDELNPMSGKIAQANQNALALIVGISEYDRTNAPAIFADNDAQFFQDYAALKLGISENNITTLVNGNAEQVDVLLSVKNWLSRAVRQNQSDVYIFFAGHGLASDDGEKMYLLPYDGAPELLEDTAVARDRLFSEIATANPRSVTVFLDTCYSGATRGKDVLLASRPIAIRAKEQAVPEGFTVMTAAAGDQTAKPLEEAKHGMFSYFLMKGMEGDADANQDNLITAGELHAYVQQNVIQQSSGSQTPELQGDADRVLVRFQ